MTRSPGAGVWLALAVAGAVWTLVTAFGRRRGVPGVAGFVHWWLECWLGRLALLALWAEAGFHVFGQRP